MLSSRLSGKASFGFASYIMIFAPRPSKSLAAAIPLFATPIIATVLPLKSIDHIPFERKDPISTAAQTAAVITTYISTTFVSCMPPSSK